MYTPDDNEYYAQMMQEFYQEQVNSFAEFCAIYGCENSDKNFELWQAGILQDIIQDAMGEFEFHLAYVKHHYGHLMTSCELTDMVHHRMQEHPRCVIDHDGDLPF
ncbi:hypothetical protein [Mongoliitalea daihaiensis]|uniref:hypothetical protein n=1 Tax=Mongoliitalea daihaiensis TaxID=2782006 RepID=UPI001F18F362|nr:hypothetical protein [Mongoliitalea daihaiensis]UJP64016.1 hypothetical protein IPZ59_14470 [Mongoliitalea daihaiensis]